MSKAGFIEILSIDKIGTRLGDKTGLSVCLQGSIPTAKPRLALPSLIGLILKDLQGLHLGGPVHGHLQGRQIALSPGYFLRCL
jgi:hypothetical protein